MGEKPMEAAGINPPPVKTTAQLHENYLISRNFTEIGKKVWLFAKLGQAEPGREFTQPSPHLLAEPCTTPFTLWVTRKGPSHGILPLLHLISDLRYVVDDSSDPALMENFPHISDNRMLLGPVPWCCYHPSKDACPSSRSALWWASDAAKIEPYKASERGNLPPLNVP